MDGEGARSPNMSWSSHPPASSPEATQRSSAAARNKFLPTDLICQASFIIEQSATAAAAAARPLDPDPRLPCQGGVVHPGPRYHALNCSGEKKIKQEAWKAGRCEK